MPASTLKWRHLVRKAAEAFETELGWRVEQVKTPWGPKGPELARFFWPAITAVTRIASPNPATGLIGLCRMLEAGQHITLADYLKMKVAKLAYCAEIHHFFEDWDFLLTPSVSVAAFPAHAAATRALAAASVGLDVVGGVFLSVQPGAESGSVDSLQASPPHPACR